MNEVNVGNGEGELFATTIPYRTNPLVRPEISSDLDPSLKKLSSPRPHSSKETLLPVSIFLKPSPSAAKLAYHRVLEEALLTMTDKADSNGNDLNKNMTVFTTDKGCHQPHTQPQQSAGQGTGDFVPNVNLNAVAVNKIDPGNGLVDLKRRNPFTKDPMNVIKGRTCIQRPWLAVSKSMILRYDDKAKLFISKILLENVTKNPVTFKVEPTNPNVFDVRPQIGLIQPKDTSVAWVFGKGVREDFMTLRDEAFMIFDVALIAKQKMSPAVIKNLWTKHFRSIEFPLCSTEMHVVDNLLPEGEKFLDPECMVDKLCGRYVSQRDPHPLVRKWRTTMTAEEANCKRGLAGYLNTWVPRLDEDVQKGELVQELQHIADTMSEIKKDLADMNTWAFQAFVLVIAVLFFVVMFYNFPTLSAAASFGSNGGEGGGVTRVTESEKVLEDGAKPSSSFFWWLGM